jgi:transcriptional regulator with XRE-family HTH domain
MTLLEETLILVDLDKGKWPETAAATGVPREWISKVAQRKWEDPGVNRIEKLHKYLKAKYPGAIPEEDDLVVTVA